MWATTNSEVHIILLYYENSRVMIMRRVREYANVHR